MNIHHGSEVRIFYPCLCPYPNPCLAGGLLLGSVWYRGERAQDDDRHSRTGIVRPSEKNDRCRPRVQL